MTKSVPQVPDEAPEIHGGIALDKRLEILQSTGAFSAVSQESFSRIASLMEETSFSAGEVIVTEEETADKLFVIAAGRAEVWTNQADGRILVATLHKGELFGEMGLLEPGGKRQATVIAAAKLTALTLNREQLNKITANDPALLRSLKTIGDFRRKLDLIKRYSPFSPLPLDQLAHLVSKLETVHVDPGDAIIREGETGDSCYLLLRGKMGVEIQQGGKSPRKVATMYPGCILGEAALITDQPRNATVLAMEPCELIVIRRSYLMDTLKGEEQILQQFIDLVHLRDRPQRIDGVIVHNQATAEGDILRILKNPLTGAYARLSPEAWFIWELLDGRHTLKDLVMEFMAEMKMLVPDRIASIVADLARSGFVHTKTIHPDIVPAAPVLSRTHRYMSSARRVLEYRLTFSRVDALFEGLYHRGGRLIFTKLGQIIIGLILLCGLIAYFMVSDGVQPIIKDPVRSLFLLIFLIPATFISLLLHEIAHGLTTKHYARKIRGAGIGWYWFGPIAFVDTTDMWTTARWPRIAVSLAGPYTFFVLASIASLIALLSESQLVAASWWQFAMVSYFNVARNLNPLFEYDGYFVLSDFLDKPNLRQQCLGWIGQHLWENLRNPAVLRKHLGDLSYGFLSVVFVGLMAFFAVSTYSAVLESILTPILPAFLMTALPWIVAAATVASGAIAIIGDMRGPRSPNS